MPNWRFQSLLITILILMTACSSGNNDNNNDDDNNDNDNGDNPSTPCQFITGGNTTVNSTLDSCAGCSVDDINQAIDGNNASYATVNNPSGNGTIRVRATAQNGIVYAGGSQVGLSYNPVAYGGCGQEYLRLKTFLNGTEQEVFTLSSNIGGAAALPRSESKTEARTTASDKPFNAVEVESEQVGCSNTQAMRIHEFCHDF